MKFFFGLLIGLFLAVGIAAGAAYMAFGELGDFGERDKSTDITQQFELTGFDKIDVGGFYEIDVTVGGDFSVSISGAPDEMTRVKAGVENGVLKLGQDRPERGQRRWRNQGLAVEISMPSLVAIDVAGVVDGDVSGISADSFDLDLSGVGDIELSGTCNSLTARVSGVGDLDAGELQCKTVDISISGVGDASVYASEAVDASISGIGSIAIYGSPSDVDKDGGFLSSITVK